MCYGFCLTVFFSTSVKHALYCYIKCIEFAIHRFICQSMKLCPYMDLYETTKMFFYIWTCMKLCPYMDLWNYFAKLQWFYALISSLSTKKLFIWHFIWWFFTKESLFSDSFVFQALLNSYYYVIMIGWCSYLFERSLWKRFYSTDNCTWSRDHTLCVPACLYLMLVCLAAWYLKQKHVISLLNSSVQRCQRL